MAAWSKFYAFLGLLPEVPRADQLIPHHQKFKYTAISLFIFLAASQIPLYGIQLQPDTRPDWVDLIFASNPNTLMTLGITPVLVSEISMQLLLASKSTNVDNNAPEARTLLNGAQKLLGILTTILGALVFVLKSFAAGKLGTGNAVLVMLQLLFSGIVVIYLDDILKKGYGLLSSVSLFTATNICVNIVWNALSPMTVIYHEQDAEFEGAVLAWFHLLITRTDKLSAMCEAFYRQNLPNVINLLATCLFVPIAIFFQGSSIALPVRTRDLPRFQVNYLIKLSNISCWPIILYHVLISDLCLISKRLYTKYGGNKLVNLLGKWNGSNHFGQSIPVGGVVYYLTAPQTLADLHRDPFHAFIYVAIALSACALLSVYWLRVCASSKRFRDGFVVLNEEQRVTRAQADSIPWNEFMSHVTKAACFGGFCVGALIILGDFIGVFGSGSGIMLAVAALYPCFNGRAGDVGAKIDCVVLNRDDDTENLECNIGSIV